MKTKLFYIAAVLFTAHISTAQVLYTENFDNLTVGNVGTDITGTIPGQGGWYTKAAPFGNGDLSDFQIIAESGRGNIIQINNHQKTGFSNQLEKNDISTDWINRAAGNNIYKFEYDFFYADTESTNSSTLYISTNNYAGVFIINTVTYGGITRMSFLSDYCTNRDIGHLPSFPNDTWVRIIIYIDYANHKLYFTIPSLGVIEVGDLLPQVTIGNSLNTDWIPSKIVIVMGGTSVNIKENINKYDNFMTSAVDKVPLAVDDFISNKFNLFPNPTAEVVTITNNENIAIKEIAIYDINGKHICTYPNLTKYEMQVNVQELNSGTYFLHITTDKGLGIKKMIKK